MSTTAKNTPNKKNRRRDLADAIKTFVEPGDALAFAGPGPMPTAAAWEIARQFRGTAPRFSLIAPVAGSAGIGPLVHLRLAKELITAFAGDTVPSALPARSIGRAFTQNEVRLEGWTLLTLTLRLLAGALGVPFMPTNSIGGTSASSELEGSGFAAVFDPFQEDQALGAVSALRADMAFFHGLAADEDGNVAVSHPRECGAWAALGARRGAVATVERIAPREELARLAAHVPVPAHRVLAVCPTPMGAWPHGLAHHGVLPDGGYLEDREMLIEAGRAAGSEESFHDWVQQHVLAASGHAALRELLGDERFKNLRRLLDTDESTFLRSAFQASRRGRAPVDRNSLPQPRETPAYSAREMMIVAASREILRLTAEGSLDVVASGMGAAGLSAWLARERGEFSLLAGLGSLGYTPAAGEVSGFSARHLSTARMSSDVLVALGALAGGGGERTLGVIGAGQVDRRGNINSTLLPASRRYLTGAGGAADICAGSAAVIVVADQSHDRWVERVPYITSPGDNVAVLVSQLGVYQRDDHTGRFTLRTVYDADIESAVRGCRENLGWNPTVADQVRAAVPPSPEELRLLRRWDPHREVLGPLAGY